MSLLSRRGSEDHVWLVVNSSSDVSQLLHVTPLRRMLVAVPLVGVCVRNTTLILYLLSHMLLLRLSITTTRKRWRWGGLRWPGEPGVVGTYSVPPSVPSGALSVAGPSYLCAAEKGKQMARAWSAGNSPSSSDSDVAAQSIDAMHVAIKAFSETDFTSYLLLGKLGLADLRQLCSEDEKHVSDGGAGGATSTQPRHS
ncbi:unnamed protein product [Lactuca virosa]|uniref:Uncharacterized protein n=1 Tax=Lactuca virosa TaxID=75947 RepID=A0AAU9PCI4_9ASTR|nr:unnamed protein product [Lactuca virosa]